jgi:hypothetical protein
MLFGGAKIHSFWPGRTFLSDAGDAEGVTGVRNWFGAKTMFRFCKGDEVPDGSGLGAGGAACYASYRQEAGLARWRMCRAYGARAMLCDVPSPCGLG